MTVDMKISAEDDRRLRAHLFRDDQDEHAAALLAAPRSRSDGGLTLLVREVLLVADEDFPPGKFGYRQTAPLFIARHAGRAGELGLAYISVHNHPGASTCVGFSGDDLAAHKRLFPHLLDLTTGNPVGGLVLGSQSTAGEIWRPKQKPVALDSLRIIGPQLEHQTARPESGRTAIPRRFDRQARLFGDEGQRILSRMRVGVIGLGGGGSMVVEQLAHLGVGEIVGVDHDVVRPHNLSRIVGATPRDARRHTKKVGVARRFCEAIDRDIRFIGIDGDVADLAVARRLVDLDFLFLATDTITSRLVFNAIVHRFLVPGIQIGAKVELRAGSSEIDEIYVAVRPVFPDRGCLHCAGLIDPGRLQHEAATAEERAAQNYLGTTEVIDPSVVTLNGIAASNAVNTMMLLAVGLADPDLLAHRLFFPRDGSVMTVTARRDPDCPWCSRP
jgi:molybdopterin/thiamine biosynthesis adenylyltransferase